MTTPYLTLTRGDTWRIPWAWSQSDGSPIDLSGASIRWQLRDRVDGELFASATSADDTLQIDAPETGHTLIVLAYSATEQVPPGGYVCDQELTFADGTRLSSPAVLVKVLGDVTIDPAD